MTAAGNLAEDISALGLRAGDTVMVHCSLRAIGRPAGGPRAVLAAITSVIGSRGTVVVPTHTSNNSTTSRAYQNATAGMSAEQCLRFQETIAAFDPATTPSYRMGAFAEYVRRNPDALRSSHPQTSFAALGRRAKEFVAVHKLTSHLGNESPMAALYAADARVLLMGVGYESCTALHLAEYRLPWLPRYRPYQYFAAPGGVRVRDEFIGADLDDSAFPEIGQELDEKPFTRIGRVGGGTGRMLPIPAAVDFAVEWFTVRGHQQVTMV